MTLLRTQSFDEIKARISSESNIERGGAIAFDGDGTLWSGDVGEDFFFSTIKRADYRQPALIALRAEATEHGIDSEGSAHAIAQRLFDAYGAGKFPEERVCEMMAWGLAGWARAEVEAFARQVIETGGLEARLHREAVRVLEWARTAGIEVFVVSASPRSIVEEAVRVLGIDRAHVIAATVPYDGEVLAATIERPIPYGEGKLKGLRARIGARPIYAAFGDNAFDLAMLGAARVPVAVRPKARLLARASEVANLVEIARDG